MLSIHTAAFRYILPDCGDDVLRGDLAAFAKEGISFVTGATPGGLREGTPADCQKILKCHLQKKAKDGSSTQKEKNRRVPKKAECRSEKRQDP